MSDLPEHIVWCKCDKEYFDMGQQGARHLECVPENCPSCGRDLSAFRKALGPVVSVKMEDIVRVIKKTEPDPPSATDTR